LLGATWLVLKTEGDLRERAYHLCWYLLFAMLAAIGTVSIATPFLHIQYAQRWFTWPNVLLTAPVPVAVALVTVLLLRALANKQDSQPFPLTLSLFALSYAGLGISMYPYIVPQSVTIWQAASPENSQIFMLVGVAILIPLILGYTAWAYWVFAARSGAAITDAEARRRRGRLAAPALVRRALACRRRHSRPHLVRPACLDRPKMSRRALPT